ncbi:hypothetical protein B5F09_09100 [Erysipelatoclostridium sp. An173]|uniref:polyphosphate polymerase domain-containing protein n=1 Tax=Erysipelatoclostridium sp. An173 TaxID=1965571 RepID=UPI000B3953B4|nr:polyphosphate polymerase domain-containing protein [Erysipelatoclostridium sp. An173]OUP75634.1 hypothetical protein B5F09_09100 [Erysipelatoclostridium sp. An173]
MLLEKEPISYRHELKHRMNSGEDFWISNRLKLLFDLDDHSNEDGMYQVNSLYFDTPEDKALFEKLNGVKKREKFRIRYYNNDFSFIRLEKKIKNNGLCAKRSAQLSKEEVEKILAGDIDFLLASENPLLIEFYSKIKGEMLQPSVIVFYRREAYRYLPGNVRITIDRDLHTETNVLNFFDLSNGIAADLGVSILEVKYDEFLPDIVLKMVQGISQKTGAYSKFAQCRLKHW